MAAWNTGSSGSSSSGPATVHFPAAGTYPYELDYTQCGGGSLFLDLLTEQFVAQTDPLSVYVGYADGLRPAGSIFPFPWNGSPNVIYEGGGCCDNGEDCAPAGARSCRADPRPASRLGGRARYASARSRRRIANLRSTGR